MEIIGVFQRHHRGLLIQKNSQKTGVSVGVTKQQRHDAARLLVFLKLSSRLRRRALLLEHQRQTGLVQQPKGSANSDLRKHIHKHTNISRKTDQMDYASTLRELAKPVDTRT